MEYSVEEARSIFQHDKYATENTGIEILEVTEDHVKCAFQVEDKHRNARNMVMGGALFTLADFTFAIAANYNKPCPTVTAVSQISFLRGGTHGKIYATSNLVKEGKLSCTYEIDIRDEKGECLAIVVVNGVHVSK